ncbi:amidohydrolase family protein [Parahaliea aestuarii]|uniref:Amidohydrolase family protein n=1 Tax=Parahaliea aestuarii TaxID=1852021 RepID=A0A5C8ZVT2_9GAMM|nr:amidohydrolase family protein [Parahaliea aestuarii]TXS91692.1 amidohydrolase family protein [Parahaliea aestuarii]
MLRYLLLTLTLIALHSHAGESLLLTNVQVVDVEQGRLLQRDVLLEGGRIAGLRQPAAPAVAERTLDLGGRYLIPGLWDMHVHFEGTDLVEDNALLLPLYLAYGITAVRDASGSLAGTVLDWRREIAAGERLGPRIFTSGQKFEGVDSLWEGDREIADRAQMLAGMDEQQALGVDFIKITENTLPPALFLETVAEAHRRSLLVSTHVPLGLGIFELAAAGVSSIEHASYLLRLGSADEEDIARAVRAGELGADDANARYDRDFNQATANAAYARLAALDVAVTPTLIGGRQLAWLDETDHSDDAFLRYLTQQFTAKYQWRIGRMAGETAAQRAARKERYRLIAAQLPPLQEAGVTLLAGSDSAALNTYVYPAQALHDELALFVEAGLTPLQALQAATINGARFMRLGDDYGSISPGKRADLVVLEENPLEDIAATRAIHSLIRGGEVFDRAALDGMLDAAAARKQALETGRQ